MIIVMESNASRENVDQVIREVEALGYRPHVLYGTNRTVIACIGDERGKERIQSLDSLPQVERVMPILQPFKLASRETHPDPSTIRIGNQKIGPGLLQMMAGPCSVESRSQILEIARVVKDAGAKFLRGGAFKPRTSPYAFRGLQKEGLELLAEAREETGLLVVTELMDPHHRDIVAEYADVIQIGARNCQNFSLLDSVAELDKPVFLKRGLAATLKEFLMSAEYILSKGSAQVILCERGIRTFETEYRNTLDLNAIPALKRLSHLPVMVDPSHGTGRWDLVSDMAKAAVAAGADGLMIEVHTHPEKALSDGSQSLNPTHFSHLMEDLRRIAPIFGREMA